MQVAAHAGERRQLGAFGLDVQVAAHAGERRQLGVGPDGQVAAHAGEHRQLCVGLDGQVAGYLGEVRYVIDILLGDDQIADVLCGRGRFIHSGSCEGGW